MAATYRGVNLARDIDQYLAAEDCALARYPICCRCGEHIQQETAVRIGKDYYCDDCLDALREQIDLGM